MARVGSGLYAHAVHEFFEGVRTYDIDRALAVLADEAELQSPWGNATGREAVKEVFSFLQDAVARPSFSIQDIAGDGHVVTLTVSISGRFGRAPRLHRFRLLHLAGRLHQVIIEPA